MTREEAINILIAVAVCSTEYLYCDEHCPFYSPRNMKNGCNVWNDELVKEAVETISALRQQETVTNRNGLKAIEIDQVKQMTNADRIRAMSEDELAEAISSIPMCVGTDDDKDCENDGCKGCFLKWLQQPAEEDDNEND